MVVGDGLIGRAGALLAQAAQSGAELAVLPEYFCLIGRHDSDKLAIQEAFGHGPMQQFLADTARDLGLWLVAGTVPLTAAQPDKAGRTIVMAHPAYDQCIKASHLFNLLDARGVISVTERQAYIGRVRALAKRCADAFVTTEAGGVAA